MYHFFLTSSDSTIFLQRSPFKYEENDYIVFCTVTSKQPLLQLKILASEISTYNVSFTEWTAKEC
jgi:hypothetical protein